VHDSEFVSRGSPKFGVEWPSKVLHRQLQYKGLGYFLQLSKGQTTKEAVVGLAANLAPGTAVPPAWASTAEQQATFLALLQ
jgi:hypothetical protein